MSSAPFLIACVGKPSAGKSSFLNAVTDAGAKVGSYPFTTIDPNYGVAYYPVACPCAGLGVRERCRPRHGRCAQGRRHVPVRVLDVAGLVPGAAEGAGLGNRFLDDLRQADVLIHVVDASGTTDAAGRATRGYDPAGDIRWLRFEVEAWVWGNLQRRWAGIVRRHVAVSASALDTLHAQLAGYGTARDVVQRALDKMPRDLTTPDALARWDCHAELRRFVSLFLDERFPTVVALNKIDMPDSDKNISAILKRYSTGVDGVRAENIVLTSALAECFLRKMHAQSFIRYETGSDDFETCENAATGGLKPLDEKTSRRLETIRDLVLFRYGSTGVQDAIVRAVESLGFLPVYPVKSLTTFGEPESPASGAFRDCVLVRPGTTVREFARKLLGAQMDSGYAGAETVGGIQLAENEVIVAGKNIIKFNLESK
ncbi:hypothetical protein GGI04_002386 [Coemansia thaxteri]|uniref:OBG-type G domain-containing protein n=1 Tax=Coemansia thaxteri TaxID=2663907 RepID=A0A9W8BCN0_9FUNG|nr:hypothetical protein H4R26_003471 [Coemansia thaxteri]KAJ2005074.1 hypothetical protein GGI04_002386 [Coemansia thaxteri]KAJ2472172.1 hypothetical protein GGI02_001771 [Coemansia sp. RSA 2322]KAJ2485345.1 hypothetical protein EV174_001789 [Coemansia sp. RSA 2320]